MTYGPAQIQNVINIHRGAPAAPTKSWGFWPDKVSPHLPLPSSCRSAQSRITRRRVQAWDYAIGCHWGHKTDFLAALLCYALFFPAGWEEKCKVWSLEWVLPVIGYNLMCELVLCNTWHWLTYAGPYAKGAVSKSALAGGQKLNKDNQYEKDSADVGMFTSSSGNLQREIFFTTLGWIQSSLFQCTFMHLWASGKLPYYNDFWAAPCERYHDEDPRPQPPRGLFTHRRCRSDWSVGHLLFVTYWREFHFYWCHRMIHPWFKKGSPLKPLDIGQFLYTHFHSLHHKSYNPGPWSGLSMHPVEHFFYYSCTLLPLFFKAHPLHHLYAKFHADIAPIAGHDGMKFSGGDFHWLHHAKYGPLL